MGGDGDGVAAQLDPALRDGPSWYPVRIQRDLTASNPSALRADKPFADVAAAAPKSGWLLKREVDTSRPAQAKMLTSLLPKTLHESDLWAVRRCNFMSQLARIWVCTAVAGVAHGMADTKAADSAVLETLHLAIREHQQLAVKRVEVDTRVTDAATSADAIRALMQLVDRSFFVHKSVSVRGETLQTLRMLPGETIASLWDKAANIGLATRAPDEEVLRAFRSAISERERDSNVPLDIRESLAGFASHALRGPRPWSKEDFDIHVAAAAPTVALMLLDQAPGRRRAPPVSMPVLSGTRVSDGDWDDTQSEGAGAGDGETFLGEEAKPPRRVPGFGNWPLWQEHGIAPKESTQFNRAAPDSLFGIDCPRCGQEKNRDGSARFTSDIGYQEHMKSLGETRDKRVPFRPPAMGVLIRHALTRCPLYWDDARAAVQRGAPAVCVEIVKPATHLLQLKAFRQSGG